MSTTTPPPLKYPIATRPTPTNFQLKSPRGANLATRVWPTIKGKKPKALCLIVHGGGWHSGYFADLAKCLNDGGIYCGSYDQVSCGYSDMEPDSPGPGVTHVREFGWYVEDLFEAIDWIKKEAGDNGRDVPFFLIGESFGGLQVIDAAFQQNDYDVRIDGIICLAGLLKVSAKYLPPKPVVTVLVFLSKYYPRVVMPATDFESTFDEAFGDYEWARTTRADPKIVMEIKLTIGAAAATIGTGDVLRGKAKEFPVPFYAIHGKHDTRTSVEAMVEFVDKIGPEKASISLIDTTGHQLLQDKPEVASDVMGKARDWILKQVSEESKK